MEYVQGGDLFTRLRSVRSFSIDNARLYAGMVVLILEYLHSKNIVYRYAKPL